MSTFATFQVLMPICISIIFTVIAVNKSERDLFYWSILAGVCWIITTLVWFVFALDNSGSFALTFLWLGLGLLFMVKGIHDSFIMKKDKIWKFD